ncbi:MAG: hypothetical protein CMJ65_12260 [Planctomycetaceae bacterium]|nr:hypothetical protein [Planctomycetaceae bacterium]
MRHQAFNSELIRDQHPVTTAVPVPRDHESPGQCARARGPLGAIAKVVCCRTWLAVLVLSLWPGRSHAAAPTLTRLFPAGGQRGTTVKVECTGKFKWPVKIWAPGVKVVALKDSGQIQVTIPADLAVDRVWIRLYDAEGASPALPFLLSNLAEFLEKEPNNRLGKAQPLLGGTQSPPQGAAKDGDAAGKKGSRPGSHGVANGILQSAGDVDGFSVFVKAGSTLVADMAANARLNSPVDAVLQVVTPDGFVVAENHDGVGIDPRLAFTPTRTGTYIVRVFGFPSKPNSSITYSGAATYVYRLTLTTGPFIANAARVSVVAGTKSVPVFGWNIPKGTEVPVRGEVKSLREVESVFAKQIPASSEVGFVQRREFAGRARIRTVPFKTVGVARPGGGPGVALAPPVAVTGCLDTHNQFTRHVFQLKKGTTYSLSAESSTFELPVIPMMRIMAPDGSRAAQSSDPGTGKETHLRFSPKVDGPYEVQVFDRYRHHGPGHFYQVTIVPEETDCELTISADMLVVTPKKPLEVEVVVTRRNGSGGKLGPITIAVEGLPKGMTSAPVVSQPDGATSKKVKLTITTDGSAFSGPIRIIGKCTKPAKFQRAARTPVKFGNAFETTWLTGTAKK